MSEHNIVVPLFSVTVGPNEVGDIAVEAEMVEMAPILLGDVEFQRFRTWMSQATGAFVKSLATSLKDDGSLGPEGVQFGGAGTRQPALAKALEEVGATPLPTTKEGH